MTPSISQRKTSSKKRTRSSATHVVIMDAQAHAQFGAGRPSLHSPSYGDAETQASFRSQTPPTNGKGSRAFFLVVLCQQSYDNYTARHAYGIRRTVLYVVSCDLLTQHNQENARMSPDPFPFVGGVWGRD